MREIRKYSDDYQRIDGSPDDRCCRRQPAIGFHLKNPIAGLIVDISERGLGIESLKALDLGHRYSFSFSVGSVSARRQGEVRWCKLIGTSLLDSGDPAPIYRIGVALLDP